MIHARKRKTLWQCRLELLLSICFDPIADEVNERRWKDLLCRLAAPSTKDVRNMVRLIRLHEKGQQQALPSDLRASGHRMPATLNAMHRRFGKCPGGVVEIERLAADAALTRPTAKRGIADCVDGNILIADRERIDQRYGGQGPSYYQIPWNVVIDVAHTQGLQHLFE